MLILDHLPATPKIHDFHYSSSVKVQPAGADIKSKCIVLYRKNNEIHEYCFQNKAHASP